MSLYSDLNEVLTPYAQRIKRLAQENTELKADLSATGYVAPAGSRYTGNNLLSNPLNADKTLAGVTYTWDENTSTWTVTGTSTGTSFINLYNGFTTLSLPDGIEAGRTYYVEYEPSDNNIEIDYVWYDANKTTTGSSRTPKSMYITVPENTVGCVIRIRVYNGRTANGTTANPRIYLAVDNTNDIVSMLNSNGICTLGTGDYYVNNLIMPNNSTLSGMGEDTIIHNIYKYNTASYAILPTSGCAVNDIRIIGANNAPDNISTFNDARGRITGIQIAGAVSSAIKLNNLTISNCDSYGIVLSETGVRTSGGVIIDNTKISNCWCGIRFTNNSEYNKVSNCIIRTCNRACINDSGNNTFANTTFHGIVGFLIDGTASNSGHGTCVGCTFNHIDNIANPDTLGGGHAVFISSLTNGFVFDACQFWYGDIYLSNSRGVTVCNSQMGDGRQNPHITVEGSYPAFFNNIIFHQTPVISDEGGSEFTACYLDSDGKAIASKIAINESFSTNFLKNYQGSDAAINGVVFDWQGNSCTVSGTATARANYNIVDSQQSLLDNMQVGDSFIFACDKTDTKIISQVVFYDSTSAVITSKTGTSIDVPFTIPVGAVGIIVRFYISNGVSVNGTVSNIKLVKLTNKKMPVPLIVSFVDDDTTSDALVTRYHDACCHNGIKGTYAVITKQMEDSNTQASTLLSYEDEGFGMCIHCYQQSNVSEWNATVRTEAVANVCRANLAKGMRQMQNLGFLNFKHWITPGGHSESDLRETAKMLGCKCLIATNNGRANLIQDINPWQIKRISLRHDDNGTSENSLTGVKNIIDKTVSEGSGWLIITTHFNDGWGNLTWDTTLDDNGYPIGYSRFNEVVQYAINAGLVPMTIPQAWTYYENILTANIGECNMANV